MNQKTFLKEKCLIMIVGMSLVSCSFQFDEAKSKNKKLPFSTKYTGTSLNSIGYLEQSLIDQNLINIQDVDASILVDLKYSSKDNFFKRDVYSVLKNAYLPVQVADKLKEANSLLQKQDANLKLLVYDAVRPYSIQQILWDALDSIPEERRKAYVADPSEGSLHNYGCAIDLTIYDASIDSVLDMGTKYDFFGYLAYPRKEKEMLDSGLLSRTQINNRLLLRRTMNSVGFKTISSEWWHFNFLSLEDAKENYPLIY